MKMETQTNNSVAQNSFEVLFGKLIMHYKFEELVQENIALNKIKNLESIPLQSYIEVISKANKYARKAKLNLDSVISDSKDMIQDLKENSSIQEVTKNCFYEKLCKIFNLYFIGKYFFKYVGNDKIDKDGLPNYFPIQLKKFIKDTYFTFKKIISANESLEFEDIISANKEAEANGVAHIKCSLILTMTLLGKIKRGRNITNLLFDKTPTTMLIPDSFKKLCRIKNNKYIIFNTDYDSLDFQLAVLDLIQFVDSDNKALFNNKINSYLKNNTTNYEVNI